MNNSHRTICYLVVFALSVATPVHLQAQNKKSCHILCAPAFSVWTELHRSHIADHPRVQSLTTGAITRLPSKNNLLLLFLTSIPTQLPRLSLLFNVSWLPNSSTRVNPFTDYSASDVGENIRANMPAVSGGASFAVVTTDQTKGWLDVTPYLADLFSPAAEPDETSAYTHKLDLGVTSTVGPFTALAKKSWLHGVRLSGNLDWVATGLPKRGDELPKGERVYLDRAKGITASFALVLPIAPLP
ncbi:MAG TPA: hypothetical protein VE110_13160 [Gemmatimonadaceae bacterium]|jgi:hypothetical protein|nr:hypothetical protein [Gemmatimonadaceae bacterium]